ncbi:MAG: SDR family oxidoreductase [Opitutae bacterium]|nr:SDR family oxidoreductase [Opitutae bacterium]
MAAAISPVALVTGASRGIGRAAAQKLAARGVRVALNYHRNEAAAREALASLPGTGHAIFQADVSDPAACAALIDGVVARCGRLDVLVNNAGLFEEHDPRTVDFATWEKSWRRTMAANLHGPAHLAFLAAQVMRPRGAGRIVNITSRGAFRGEPTAPAYGASKAGLNSFGQSLSKALAPDKIYVYTIAPGWVDTDMAKDSLTGPNRAEVLAQHPLGRVATPEEVADTIAWLALDAPAAMTGAILDLNGASYLRT